LAQSDDDDDDDDDGFRDGGFLAMVMYCAVAHTDDDGFRDGNVFAVGIKK